MGKGPFKMKGSPMQRNFGISPVKKVPEGLKEVGRGFQQIGHHLAKPFVEGYKKVKKIVKDRKNKK